MSTIRLSGNSDLSTETMMTLCSWGVLRSPKRLLIVGLWLLALGTLYVTIKQGMYRQSPVKPSAIDTLNPRVLSNLLKSSGRQACIHPELQLWHPEIAPYFKDVPPLQCSQVEENWVYTVNGTFRVSESAKEKHGQVLCEFTPIVRGNDDFKVLNGQPIKPLKDYDPMPADYGEVKCVGSTGKVYKNLMLGVAPKTEQALALPKVPKEASGLNILMFGFDSTSRMTWMRNLPQSHQYFTQSLGGIVLEGYNIVGDGTPQALLPMLTGKPEPELPEARRGFKGASPVDGHPWIWRDLKRAGYMTQWGEDETRAGTFTYRMLGFAEPPVDHYIRPFYLRAEKEYGSHKPYCLGSLPRHANMLNWVRDFYSVYHNTPKFSFVFHTEFTHGGYSKVRVVDKDLLSMLQELHDGGHLDNTLLILMADHGARFQEVRQTVQGKYEERMPYFGLRFPPKFQEKHPQAMKNLRANIHRLTTPYDIHATFEHLLNFSQELTGDVKNREISVLKEIPVERSCNDANIEAHWCACLNWQNIDTNSSSVKSAVQALVDAINDIIAPHSEQCRTLAIKNITSAVVYVPNDNVLKFKKSRDVHGRLADLSDNMQISEVLYQVTIETSPGGGKFEATVKHFVAQGKYVANAKEISRINKYGDQPHCIVRQHPHLSPYCYCTAQLGL